MTFEEATKLRIQAESDVLQILQRLQFLTGLDLVAVNVFLVVRADEVDDGSGRLPRRRAEAVRIDLAV